MFRSNRVVRLTAVVAALALLGTGCFSSHSSGGGSNAAGGALVGLGLLTTVAGVASLEGAQDVGGYSGQSYSMMSVMTIGSGVGLMLWGGSMYDKPSKSKQRQRRSDLLVGPGSIAYRMKF